MRVDIPHLWVFLNRRSRLTRALWSQVKFPEPGWLPADRLRQLQAFFPPQEEVMATEDTEEVELSDYTAHGGPGRRPYTGEAYHEDDFEDGMRQHVQCQTS